MSGKIIFESAKNGKETCYYEMNGKKQYLYSKYEPDKQLKSEVIPKSKKIAVFGIGLGYEIEKILSYDISEIIIIDENRDMYEHIKDSSYAKLVIGDSKISFYFGHEYEKITENDYEIIGLNNFVRMNPNFFYDCAKHLKKDSFEKTIAFIEHHTIADDVIAALRNSGFDVIKIPDGNREDMKANIAVTGAGMLFSINFLNDISEIAENMGIKYISWTVDTPNYALYTKEIKNQNQKIIVYSKVMKSELNAIGVNNVCFLPVAADTDRLSKIKIEKGDIEKYSCDVSFLGSTGVENEFNIYSKYLTKEALAEIKIIYEKQARNPSKYMIKELIPEWLLNEFNELKKNSSVTLNSVYLDNRDHVAYHIAKKYNEIERMNLVYFLSEYFNVHVYGDKAWETVNGKKMKFMGYADHFNEMPKVFKLSKININLTRIYVDSGLPMRVFDIMGSGGFMVTNYKEDIAELFEEDKEIVIYRDLDELREKVKYYLNNEKEREKIALAGFEKVKKYHNYNERIKKIIEFI